MFNEAIYSFGGYKLSKKNGYSEYKKIDISTAPQGKLVIAMYEGAIKFLDKAVNFLSKKYGIEDAHTNILKAQDIIYELLASLNYDAGDISDRLSAIYTYMNQKLTEANIAKEKEPILEVIVYLKELKGAWQEAELNVSKVKKTDLGIKKDDSAGNGSKINISG